MTSIDASNVEEEHEDFLPRTAPNDSRDEQKFDNAFKKVNGTCCTTVAHPDASFQPFRMTLQQLQLMTRNSVVTGEP
jgi:hypothetical protein